MTAPIRPRPVLDAYSRPFWEGARDGQLTIQRCAQCGHFRHPPRPVCERCSSEEHEVVAVSGRGRVFSFTTNYQRNVSGFEEVVPYVNVIVELDEQPGLYLLGDVPAGASDWVAIDVPVEVVFEPFEDATGAPIALPQFRPMDPS